MTPPQPQPAGREVTLSGCLTCVSVVTGAVAGASWGGLRYGWLGGVLGAAAGAVLGPVAALVFWVAGYVTLIPLVILLTEGPRGVWLFIRGRWQPPGDRPEPNQTNESGG